MPIEIIQTDIRRGTDDWWDWEIHLEGSEEELNGIEYVEYTLHETFPNPIFGDVLPLILFLSMHLVISMPLFIFGIKNLKKIE